MLFLYVCAARTVEFVLHKLRIRIEYAMCKTSYIAPSDADSIVLTLGVLVYNGIRRLAA